MEPSLRCDRCCVLSRPISLVIHACANQQIEYWRENKQLMYRTRKLNSTSQEPCVDDEFLRLPVTLMGNQTWSWSGRGAESICLNSFKRNLEYGQYRCAKISHARNDLYTAAVRGHEWRYWLQKYTKGEGFTVLGGEEGFMVLEGRSRRWAVCVLRLVGPYLACDYHAAAVALRNLIQKE